MKKIINGKKYDTETAKLLNYWDNGLGDGDFNHCYEELYRKRTGEYFIYGRGGAMTKYSQSCEDNTWCAGEAITPITEKEAKQWAEESLSVVEYEEIFGEVEE